MSQIDNLLKVLESGQDSAMMRFAIGSGLLKENRAEEACVHLAEALQQDPGYSAAWKIYGKALAEAGREPEAIQAYEQGIEAAQEKGDLQAVKEMQVFLKRLHKANDQT